MADRAERDPGPVEGFGSEDSSRYEDVVRLAQLASGIPPGLSDDRAELATRLRHQMVRTRTLALHRHVHLMAALAEAEGQAPVRSILGIGSGPGRSELFIAATRPETSVLLTDHDPGRLAVAERLIRRYRLDNVSTATLDLTDPREVDGPVADLVVAVEVLEHIEDRDVPASIVAARARGFAYVVVPFCSAGERDDPVLRTRLRDRHEHLRVGYTREELAVLLPGMEPWLVRTCYHRPETPVLRQDMATASDDELDGRQVELFLRAAADVRDSAATSRRDAGGIELLARRA